MKKKLNPCPPIQTPGFPFFTVKQTDTTGILCWQPSKPLLKAGWGLPPSAPTNLLTKSKNKGHTLYRETKRSLFLEEKVKKFLESRQENGPKGENRTRRNNRTRHSANNKGVYRKVESNDSPAIPDRGRHQKSLKSETWIVKERLDITASYS